MLLSYQAVFKLMLVSLICLGDTIAFWLSWGTNIVPLQFKELAQAYEVLSDPEKREIYNQYGEDALKEGMGDWGGMHDPFDIFQSFFGGSPFGGMSQHL